MPIPNPVAALALSLGVLATAVPAVAGPRIKGIMQDITIKAPAEKVWARVGKFQDMSWHPRVTKTEGTGGEELQATRTLHLAGGGVVEQTLMYKDPMSYLG